MSLLSAASAGRELWLPVFLKSTTGYYLLSTRPSLLSLVGFSLLIILRASCRLGLRNLASNGIVRTGVRWPPNCVSHPPRQHLKHSQEGISRPFVINTLFRPLSSSGCYILHWHLSENTDQGFNMTFIYFDSFFNAMSLQAVSDHCSPQIPLSMSCHNFLAKMMEWFLIVFSAVLHSA